MVTEASTAYLNAADVHMAKNEFKDARQLFEKVLSIDPSNKTVYHKAGVVYFREGKFSEACKSLKRVFENDPSNKEIANTYLDALFNSAKEPEAEQVIRKILDSDATRTDLREKLVKIYLTKNELNKALVEVTVIAEAKIAGGDNESAEKILKRFVFDTPEYIPGRKKLGDFYRSIGRVQDGAAIYFQAAEHLLKAGDEAGAKTFLNKALELSPDLQEARKLLDRLEPAMPVATVPEPIEEAVPPLAEPTPDYQQPEPKPSATAMPTFEENPAINEAFTEIDVLVKYGLTSKALEQLEMLAATYPDSPLIRVRLKELYQEQGNAPKTVEHALALADIYSRNNLTDHSDSVLNSALSIDPTNAVLLAKLGRAPIPSEALPAETAPIAPLEPPIETLIPAEAFESASPEVSLPEPPPVFEDTLQIQGSFPTTDEIAFEGLDAGIPHLDELDLSPEDRVQDTELAENAGSFSDQPQEVVETREEPIAQIPEPESTIQHPLAVASAEESGSLDESPQVIETREEPVAQIPELESTVHQQLAAVSAEESGSHDEPPQVAETLEEPVAQISELELIVQQPIADIPPETGEIWSEAEFYFQQGLFDEAKKHYTRIIELNPSDQRAIERLEELSREEEQSLEFSKLAEAVEDLEGTIDIEADGQELPLSVSDEDAVRTLMREISQLKNQQEPASPLAEKESVSPQRPEQTAGKKTEPPVTPTVIGGLRSSEKHSESEEDFFDLGEELNKENKIVSARTPEQSSEDFFDLAAELRDELSTIAVPERITESSEEQSLDEIFEDFKRGVEQQSVKEDVDTHYNLGVAYKEMGLLDDAVSEFTMTPEDVPKFIQSRYMLGLCYMEKGEYQNAAAEILYALRCTASQTGEKQDTLGMHYDLGLAYQGAGNLNNAINEFQIVLALDSGYRDTMTKLKELQQGDFISLDQLKDDIEREISSKFLKEGERIEREERNRKNEKVRN
jgi:tetratricopeptide (TPR) repeat protein